ncbi:uncharacterized protein LOC127706549 [Mytilus californianus]|uniref:uncharacterized protein LOC127706549 n=1 Tax=Mytilus californianus TaxID=6549 RepID=UPI00224747C6|nr:uncharacterized protein LOC127706549 [Mytilus californianus]
MERKDRNTYMTNYVRLCFVAQYENRNLLEELLKNQLSLGHTLQLKRINSVFKFEEAELIRECFELNCFDKLDLCLLYLLIKKLQLVEPTFRRWSANSYPKVLTIEDGVELIYQKYNLILHSGKTTFTNEEVRELFSIFNDIAITFDHFCMSNTGNKSVTRYVETCCVDYEMRSRYRNHLHVLEMNLKETKGPRYYPLMYGREEFQLSPEITNYMRVIYAIQVELAGEVRKYIASRLPPEFFFREMIKSKLFDELPLNIKYIVGQCHHQGYKHFSLYLIRLLIINTFFSFETFDINWILTERHKIIYRGNAGLTDIEMRKSFSVLTQIAKDLELEMEAPHDSIVAKLEYYKTCCMDERTFEWFKEGLTYIAGKEQQFGTFRNNPESTPRYWYLPPGHDLEHLQYPESRYTLIGYAFEDTLSTILRELLHQIVPPVVIFNWIVLTDHLVRYFNATEYLKFLEGQENGYTDFDTMLLSSVLLKLQKKEVDAKVLEAIKKTKQELLCRRNKELTDTETMYYFSVFKDVARLLDRILLSPKQKCVALVEQLENMLTEGEQLKHFFASLLKKKSQKPVWMEKGRFGKTPSLLDSREFYELLEHGYYDSYENRIYLGGPCNAGKTSLACVLTGDEVPDKWISTNGLQIYFGQNGIHLKDKKMIQIRKGMLCHTVHGKVIAAIKNIQKEDVASKTEVNKVEKKEMVAQSFAIPEFEDDILNDEWFHLKQTLKDNIKKDEILGNDLDKDKTQQMRYGSRHMKSNFDRRDMFDSTLQLIKTPTLNINEIEELGSPAAKEKETENSYPEYLKVLTYEASALSNTSNVLQEDDLRKSILDEIRSGEYNLEIAPSDLVDFGGQKAFDMTHQLFILQEGTVLLLFDGSKDLDEPLPEYPGKKISSADILLHWVNSVSTYCTEDSGMQRIQFVATHRDRYKNNYEIRRTELVAQLTATFKEHENISYLFLDNLFFIDARKNDDNEIDKLKDKLVQIAFSQSSWGMKMPLIWVPLEKQIMDLKLRGTSILRIEEIQKLNRLNEDLMMDDEKLNFFLRTQHAIGKLIFFDQDELSKCVIIEPSVLVNALRSFVTDEMFFPTNNTEYHRILKKLQEDGMLKKTDLMKLWNQDEFQAIFQNQEFKDFLVKILLHLDVLVEPKLVNQDVNVPPEYYIIPCMIQTRLNNDYAEKYLNRNKSICMAYDFKIQLVPPCVLFRLIASALGIWPLKVYQGRKMIFQDIATFVFDEKNEFSIIMQGRKIIIYFTNLNSVRNIQSPNVASVQECLTIAMISISEFYQLNSRKLDALNRAIFEKQFELEYGAACKRPCFVKRSEELKLSKAGMWKCQHSQFHEFDFLLYWDSKQTQKNAQKSFKSK